MTGRHVRDSILSGGPAMPTWRPLRRVASGLLTAGLLIPGLLLVAPGSQAGPATAAPAATSAVTTVSGSGAFAALHVTVSQTRNLIDQVVGVSWTGGAPTEPSVGAFDRNYLQIMQCWGDDPAGPTREQCQFGGLVGDSRGGSFVPSRQVSYGRTLVDPLETYKQAPGSFANVNVPFQAVSGKSTATTLNEFYDASSTNELPFGRTRDDGTGSEFFEVETAREAPGLGCGEPVVDPATGVRRGRSCWLAIVPRGATEVDGSATDGGGHLNSSPLSAGNWAHRLVVPLSFQPIGINCPIGSAERRTVGQESVAEAITHWQPALCLQSKTVYGFSSVNDDLARNQLRTPTPGVVFVSKPLDATNPPATGPAVYAPVALSGLAIAFNIDSSAASSASAATKLADGARLRNLNLSARLVAKLLTQSYQLGVFPQAPSVAGNPPDLLRDPDFLALNPTFKDLFLPGLASALEPLGLTDVFGQLWSWIDADPAAHAFLQGTPDPYGMKVNTNYKGLEIPRSDLPKSDLYCADLGPAQPPLCTLNAHPYAADLHDAARAASRGDTLSRSVWDPTATPPVYKKGLPQLSGSRLVMAITDTASAERYRLPTAKLLNAAGNFVAPTTASLLAGVAAMTAGSTPEVLQGNPRSTSAGAYPLTNLTYAATVSQTLDAQARTDYVGLLRYAVGAGQTSGLDEGQLPPGYAPLPEELRQQTLRVAAALAVAPVAVPVVTSSPAGVPAPAAVVASVDALPTLPALPVLPPVAAAAPQVAPPAHVLAPTPAAVVAPRLLASGSITPVAQVGGSRLLLGWALLLGALASLGGPAVLRLGSRKGGGARA